MWQLCQYSQKRLVTHTGITVGYITSGHLGQDSNKMQVCHKGPPSRSRRSFPQLSRTSAAESWQLSYFWKMEIPLSWRNCFLWGNILHGSSLCPMSTCEGKGWMEQWLSPLACTRDNNERHTCQITIGLSLVLLASSLTDVPESLLP